MDIISKQICEQCGSLEKCVSTAMHYPEIEIKCVHFGYATKLAKDCMNIINTHIYEYLIHHIGDKEN